MSQSRFLRTSLLIAVFAGLFMAAAGLKHNIFRQDYVSAQEQTVPSALYLSTPDRGEGWRVTINLTNLESRAVNVEIMAYDHAGRSLGEVSALTTLEESKTTAMDWQSLPPGAASLAVKASGQIAANAVFTSGDGAKSEVIPALSHADRQLDFPLSLLLDGDSLTERTVTLLNPGPEAAAATLIALGRDGAELERQALPLLAPMESRELNLAQMFGESARGFSRMRSVAAVRIVSDYGLTGWQMATRARGDLAGLPALIARSLAWNFYLPEVERGKALQTGLKLYNPGESAANVSVEAFDANQNSLGTIEAFSLAPGAIHSLDAANAASLRATSDQPISGYQTFAVADGQGLAAAQGIAAEDRINVGYALTGSSDGRTLAAYPMLRLASGIMTAGFAETREGDWTMAVGQVDKEIGGSPDSTGVSATAAAAAATFSGSGKVADSGGGFGIAGVTIAFFIAPGSPKKSIPAAVVTDANGNWSQTGFQSGAVYRVTPQKKLLAFTPAYQDFSDNNSALNFTAVSSVVKFSASGKVANAAGLPLKGVALTFTRVSGAGAIPAPVVTDANGFWVASGFGAATIYRVTPKVSGYLYTPAYRDFSTPSGTLNFTGSTTFSGSGKVADSGGGFGIAGVTIAFSIAPGSPKKSIPASVVTDANGNWSQTGFQADAVYRVTPQKAGLAFTPAYQDFSADNSAPNFTAVSSVVKFSASGKVTNAAGLPLKGVALTFTRVSGTGAIPAPVVTDANGNWVASGFGAATIYRVTPNLSGYLFNPAYRDFSTATATLNFTGYTTFSGSGKVTNSLNGLGSAGVTMVFSIAPGSPKKSIPASVVTDANGNWSQTGFQAGAVYRVTPQKAGITFTPAYRDFSDNNLSLNFTSSK